MNPTIRNPDSSDLNNEQKSEVTRLRSNLKFIQVLEMNFAVERFEHFNPFGKSGSVGSSDKNSIGEFDGVDIFRVQKFDGGNGGPENTAAEQLKGRAERAVHGPLGETGAIGFRDFAYYNQKHDKTLQLDTENGIRHLVQRGIDGAIPDLTAQTQAVDKNNVNTANTELITSWIDTYGITFNENKSAKIRDTSEPGVTFRRNTYFEIDVNFQNMQCPGHRHSLWLWPATEFNGDGPAVLFNDTGDYKGDVVYTGRSDAVNGVEIDIYEHVITPGRENTLLMKAISGDQDDPLTDGSGNTINEYQNPFNPKTHVNVDGINSGYHKIGFLWLEKEMIWFVDGIPLVKDIKLMPNNRRMSIILSREASPELFGGNPQLPENRTNYLDDIVKIRSLNVWDVAPIENTFGADSSNVATNTPVSTDNTNGQVTAHRFSATTGLVAWDPGQFTQFNVISSGKLVNSTPIVASSFEITNLTPGQVYVVEVWAINGGDQKKVGTAVVPTFA